MQISESDDIKNVATDIVEGCHIFSIPVQKKISKHKVGKKRIVYSMTDEEMMCFRIISYALYRYDYLFSPNLYSFRRNIGVKDAVLKVSSLNKKSLFGVKLDIHDYFNSIDPSRLLNNLNRDIDDPRLISMLGQVLIDDRAIVDGHIEHVKKGVMAGLPISAFLSNYYLRKLDEIMTERGCEYFRYADDILILTESEAELEEQRAFVKEFISAMGLEMNDSKETVFHPGEPITFLGFSISNDTIDISDITAYKMKRRIRRTARSIRRWMLRNRAPVPGTIRAMIRYYNGVFYGHEDEDFTWSLWYFGIINTDKTLHEIDVYFQEWLRYIATGHHNKRNYSAISYENLKSHGLRPLVSEYYRYRDGKINRQPRYRNLARGCAYARLQ